MSTTGHYQKGLSAFNTPSTPLQSNKTFDGLFSIDHNRKDVFSQLFNEHLKGSTIMQTPATPNSDITGLNKVTRNNKENDDEQHFYSTPSSRMFT